MFERVKALFDGGRRFVLSTHVNPDGDGVGSELALWHFLRGRGKDAWIVNNGPLTRNLAFLDPGGVVRVYDPGRDDELLRAADAIVVLDNSAPQRLGRLREPIFAAPAPKVCIDHHPDPDPCWDVLAIREDACATGEVVRDLIAAMGGSLTPAIATAIYTAVVTDTGHFRFSNTRASTHRLASELVAAGVDVPGVYQQVYEQNSAAYTRLLGAALSAVELVAGGRIGVLRVTREMMRHYGSEDEDTSDIINAVLGIGGVSVAVLLKEMEDGQTKISFRSRGSLDVNRLAREFGGGGHRNASGAVVDQPLDRLTPRVLAQAEALVRSVGGRPRPDPDAS